MYFLTTILSLCLVYRMVSTANSEHNYNSNHLTADDIEKRRSVREFFDSLVAGSNQNTKTSTHTASQTSANTGPTQRPDGPIYMPFAVPVHTSPPSPHQSSPHVHIAPPSSYGYPSSMSSLYRSPHSGPPPHSRPHLNFMPNYDGHHHNHGPNGHSHNFPMAPVGAFGPPPLPQSHHFPIQHNHFDYGQQSRPIAIAIPLPLHAIPLHLLQHNDDNSPKPNGGYTDYGDGMSATTKFALFADPFEEIPEDDFYDGPQNPRYINKYLPIHKNEK